MSGPSAATGFTTLTFSGLTLERGRQPIVQGLELVVGQEPGVRTLLVGPSGAGKSTLMAAAVGDLAVKRGDIRLGATSLLACPVWMRARLGLGYVPQGPSVLWDLSAEDNLRAFRSMAGGMPPSPAEPLSALLDKINLSNRSRVRARDLSGGERRRLEIGRALLLSPKVLLLDEPFAGLDPKSARRLCEVLATEAQERQIVLFFTDHRVDEALSLADRALLMVEGALVADAPPADFVKLPEVLGRYLGS